MSDRGNQRFDRDESNRILSRAAELADQDAEALSMEELKEAAADIGVSAEMVERAVDEKRLATKVGKTGPSRVAVEALMELKEGSVETVVGAIRRHYGHRAGEVEQVGSIMTIRGAPHGLQPRPTVMVEQNERGLAVRLEEDLSRFQTLVRWGLVGGVGFGGAFFLVMPILAAFLFAASSPPGGAIFLLLPAWTILSWLLSKRVITKHRQGRERDLRALAQHLERELERESTGSP